MTLKFWTAQITLITVLVLSAQASPFFPPDNLLRPFTSDGCSMSPDGTVLNQKKWLSCCVEHDKKYWLGGTEQEKLSADKQLHSCLMSKGMSKAEADIWYYSVLTGGHPKLPTSWRWGYGWYYQRPYAPLTLFEKAQAVKYLPLLDLPTPVRSQPQVNELKAYTYSQCKQATLNYLKRFFNFKSPTAKHFEFYPLKDWDKPFQVFSSDCPGGFFIVNLNTHRLQPNCNAQTQVSSVKVFGSCNQLRKLPN